MRTAVLGTGKMGVWFAKYCKSKGDTVILAGRNAEKLAELKNELGVETADFPTAVRGADRVLICVSISSFEEIVKTISPAVHADQPIMDICSIKEYPINIMHQHLKDALVLGTHPVFGPGSNGVAHKAYVLTPTNPKEQTYAEEFKAWLEKDQAHVFVMTPQKHDELMGIVLGFPHFLGLAACETLLEQPGFSESKKLAGTTYRMLVTLAESVAMETPDLYANVQTKLANLDKMEERFITNAQQWLDLMKKKDSNALMERMNQLRTKLEKTDNQYTKSYETMYKMLQSTEE
ncbi:prephenate dehydrogenase/arogenate dehydrogenase family protein [Candidatus Bathycorpusculum sp.]|uniref:prephenate dehydrogenase/arogenate dehydrogenase family protein n=1 Tax=Candidatus Bathycorpusculum sp. TaxID=2994959 RepID=UPI0028393567|nr:prephenate dehydrogenase/arogenate dehydrogenase family protein [Candidatus Termitimicrobium sp.]